MASEDETQSPNGDSSPHGPNLSAYREYLALLEARLFASSEAYDRALLTLSSAFLLVSVSFISEVVELAEADHLWLLRGSWLLLVAAILTVVFSFQIVNLIGDKLREGAKRYFLHGQEPELNAGRKLTRFVDRLNWATGGMFAFGVTALTLFVILNLPPPTATPTPSQEATVDKRDIIRRGLPLPNFDEVPSAAQQQQPQQDQSSQPNEPATPHQESE